MRQWFSLRWYKYLFEEKDPNYSWFEVLKCRIQNHPNGVVWFDVGGVEPDMHCKDCGDYLG